MRFWRIDLLKNELQRSSLRQVEAFGYVFATVITNSVLAGPPAMWGSDAESTGLFEWGMYATTLVVVGIGTYLAYRANGGSNGTDFVTRYFSLGWVLMIRFIVLVAVPAFAVAFVAFVSADLAWPGRENPSTNIDLAGIGFLTCLLSVYYWRLCHHFRQVATGLLRSSELKRDAG